MALFLLLRSHHEPWTQCCLHSGRGLQNPTNQQMNVHRNLYLCSLFRKESNWSDKCWTKQNWKHHTCWHFCWFWFSVQTTKPLPTLDIRIINRTTKVLKPSSVSPTRAMSQKELSSQARSWMFRKFTKWRISAHEGSLIPQCLYEYKIQHISSHFYQSTKNINYMQTELNPVLSKCQRPQY